MKTSDAATEITRASKSNLAFAFIAMSGARRRDITTFYAFCRVIDDIADDNLRDPETKRRELARWRQSLRGEFANEPALAEPVRQLILTYPITPEMLETILRTNSLGALLVSQAFVPFLKKSDAPRIVNVSSGGGQLTDGADGWAPAYCISKTALNGVTVQLAHALPKFAINSVCPGWVRTDMGGANATRSVAEGASGIVWLAADAPQKETSKFWRDRKVIPW